MEKEMNPTNLVFQTTLEGMEGKLTDIRRDGNTTRIVDNAIQILFSGKVCVVMDHHNVGRHSQMNEYLLKCILRRLEIEHRWLVNDKRVNVAKNKKFAEVWLNLK
jgi:hypothetical protein